MMRSLARVFETYELWDEIIKACGPKRIADAVGRDLSTVYRWARNPMDASPDGTGSNGVLDWFECVVEAMAARPAARPTLRRLELWSRALFMRCIDHYEYPVVTLDDMRAKSSSMLRHTADLLDECGKGTIDYDRILNVTLEAREQLERIAAAADRMLREREESPALARAR